MSSVFKAKGFGSLVALFAAVGFAVHLLGSETPSTTERSAPAELPAPTPVAAEPREAEPERREPDDANRAPTEAHPATPSVEQLQAELADDPDAVLRSLTRVLPKGERDAQKLKVLEVQALVKNGQIGTARGRASDYFERWPNGPDTATLEALTGAHPRLDRPR